MKSDFFEYYPPTLEQYDEMWRAATVVIDTNVLLNLYRLPSSARDDFFEILDLIKDRIWIPFQVALEFQRRRLTVIGAERKSTEGALSAATELVSALKKQVEALQIDKRGVAVDAKPLLDNIEQANEALIKGIELVHEAQLDIASSDPIRDRLDQILKGKVGLGPQSQADLDALVADGEMRFSEKIPPGFADVEKDKNPNEATFIHNQIKYQRKFGDLIIWKQVIDFCKEKNIKSVILVTADKKEDWWWREQGKTIGPHPELVREISEKGAVDLFWMYSSVQFMENAKKYTQAKVSDRSVAELKEVVDVRHHQGSLAADRESHQARSDSSGHFLRYGQFDYGELERPVYSWLNVERNVERNGGGAFPDFVADHDGIRHGYEVKYVRNFEKFLFTPPVINSMMRGYIKIKENRLDEFTVIVVVPSEYFWEISVGQRHEELKGRLRNLLERYPISGMVVGSIVSGERFIPIAEVDARR